VLLLRTKQGTKRLDLALEPGVADLQVVPFGLDFLEFDFKSAHLIDTLLAIATGGHGVCLSLFDFG
jgi:hypothetical protein